MTFTPNMEAFPSMPDHLFLIEEEEEPENAEALLPIDTFASEFGSMWNSIIIKFFDFYLL